MTFLPCRPRRRIFLSFEEAPSPYFPLTLGFTVNFLSFFLTLNVVTRKGCAPRTCVSSNRAYERGKTDRRSWLRNRPASNCYVGNEYTGVTHSPTSLKRRRRCTFRAFGEVLEHVQLTTFHDKPVFSICTISSLFIQQLRGILFIFDFQYLKHCNASTLSFTKYKIVKTAGYDLIFISRMREAKISNFR